LDDEDVLAADVFVDFDEHLHVGETADGGAGERQVERGGDRLGERPIAVAGDDFHSGGFMRLGSSGGVRLGTQGGYSGAGR
jgi:hypothetical protein